MEFLHQLGIDIGLAVAGFFGSIAMIVKKINKGEKISWFKGFLSISAGILTAVYITPLVLLLLKIEGNGAYGAGFVVGYLGLQAIEMLTEKYKPKTTEGDGSGTES